MVNQPIDILDRPMVDVPRVLGAATVAERYLVLRSRRLTSTHQAAMDEFARTVGQSYRTTDDLMTAYFARFKRQRDSQFELYNKQVFAINSDKNIDFLRKQTAIQNLRVPLMAAWTTENETGFQITYGDPRIESIDWNSRLRGLGDEQVRIVRDGRIGAWVRTKWEMMIPHLLQHVELDGSVAPCVLIDGSMVLEADSRASALFTRTQFAPPADPDLSPALYAAMVKAANAVCPHCLEVYAKGFRAHELSCARRHGVQSIHVADDPLTRTRPDDEDEDEPVAAEEEGSDG